MSSCPSWFSTAVLPPSSSPVYEAGNGERSRLFEGAVDGIGTDLGKFWIKDASGKKLVDQTPPLPNRAVAFKLVADAFNSGQFPAPKAIGHRVVCGGPTSAKTSASRPQLIDEIESYAALAPLHTPIAVYIMRQALKLFPGMPNFAILDTYFHRTIPEVATRDAHPRGVRGDGRAPLRLSRHLLRVDRLPVAAQRAGEADRRPSRQRRFHLRHPQRPVPRHLHGPHAHRRHHQRHAHRRHRSRRVALHPATRSPRPRPTPRKRRTSWKP